MDYAELRNVFFKALEELKGAASPQLGVLRERIFKICCDRKHFEESQRTEFDRGYSLQITDLFWEFVISQVLGIGKDEENLKLPFFHITEFGKRCIETGEISVYDPTGLVDNLKKSTPELDSLIEEYLLEALVCFGRGCFKAATVMIGCASEQLFLLIIDAFKEHFSDSEKRKKFEKSIEKCSIKVVFDEFQKRFEILRKELRQNTQKDDWSITVASIFNLIRRYRNDAGHPQKIKIEKQTVLGLILIFCEYCKSGYELKDYFNQKKSKII